MRQPPPVSLPSTTPRAWRLAVDLLALLTCAALIAWAQRHAAPAGWAMSASWLLAMVCSLITLGWARRSRRLPDGRLHWDGSQWHWQRTAARTAETPPPGFACLVPVLDCGHWMLLRLPPQAPVRWLAIERGASPGAWHLMCCAVYSSGSTTTATAPRTAVTTPPGTPTAHDR